MTMKVRLGGVWKDISGARIFKSGAWRSIVAVKIYKDGAWREVANFTPPAPGGGGGGGGTLSVNHLSDFGKGGHSSTLTSGNVSCVVSGGLAPYHYSWAKVSDNGEATFTINGPSSATTTVTATGLAPDTPATITLHCTVTDSLGVSATTNDATGTFENSSLL
jgi:hypothetical protein